MENEKGDNSQDEVVVKNKKSEDEKKIDCLRAKQEAELLEANQKVLLLEAKKTTVIEANQNTELLEAKQKAELLKAKQKAELLEAELLIVELVPLENDFKNTIKNLIIWVALSSFLTVIFYFLIKSVCFNIQISTIFPFLACVMAGILGSSIAAFISTLERYSAGIEFGDGRKYPISPSPTTETTKPKETSTKQTYNKRFANFLRLRPILGVYTSILVYFGASFFINEQINEDSKLVFISPLCGFFAKTLLENMKTYFERIIGKAS